MSVSPEYTETAFRFGPDRGLLGIVTQPLHASVASTAMLLMNAGILHRIGPHRLNVKIARALARQGMTSLRIDLSGLGDSAPPRNIAHSGEQSTLDLQAAMDHLQATHGIDRFMVFGLCSGAVNGYRLALKDERVTGLLMFDGFVYPTIKTHVLRRLTRLRTLPVGTLFAKIPQRIRHWLRPPAAVLAADDPYIGTPSRPEFTQAMNMLTARGTSLYLMFSGSFIEGHNYQGQLRDAFRGADFLDHMRDEFHPDMDHTATTLDTQRAIVGKVSDWARSVVERKEPA